MNDRGVQEPSELQVGGPVDSTECIYITRDADREFLALLADGEFVNVVTSRQMGKTSLVYSAMTRLADQGYRFAYLDLSPLRTETDPRIWFQSIIEALARELGLAMDVPAFWSERAGQAASQGFIDFFRHALAATRGTVVVILDEIDATLELDFADDLFTAIRSIYNARPRETVFKRLSFCLVGVATPNELIKSPRTTPYNIGRTIWLRDFDPRHDDLAPFTRALDPDPAAAQQVLARILHWTGGQPYLTAWLCEEARRRQARDAAAIDAIVETAFASLERLHHDAHFEQTLRFMSERITDSGAVIDLYDRILGGAREPDQAANPAYAHLKLSGLVKRDENGLLVPRNRIYQRLFDRDWVRKSRPRQALTRARRVAYAAVAALAAVIVFGAVYYATVVAPLREEQLARRALEQLQVAVRADVRGHTVVRLPPGDANELLMRAAPHIQALASLGDESLALALELDVATEIDLRLLSSLAGLRRLVIASPQVTELGPLAALASLRELDISGTGVADLGPIARLSALERLSAPATRVGDLKPLAGLESLEVLELSATPVRDLMPLAELRRLRRLDVSNTPVADLAPLARLERLEELDVARTQVRDLGPLQALPALRHLALDGLGPLDFSSGAAEPPPTVLRDPPALAAGAEPRAGTVFRDCPECPQMLVLPAGAFVMGSATHVRERDEDEGPAHTVTIAQPFAIGRFELRADEWMPCVRDGRCPALRDSGFGRGARPVLLVSWHEATAYAEWLSQKSGRSYRLLSEAEWEYAARAGTPTERFWGNATDRACAFANIADETVREAEPVFTRDWVLHGCRDDYAFTAPVGRFAPNAFGMHDPIGNVWEWVQDCYHDDYAGAPNDGSAWTDGPCETRVLRGGSWGSDFPHNARSAARGREDPATRSFYAGFRVARSLQ